MEMRSGASLMGIHDWEKELGFRMVRNENLDFMGYGFAARVQ